MSDELNATYWEFLLNIQEDPPPPSVVRSITREYISPDHPLSSASLLTPNHHSSMVPPCVECISSLARCCGQTSTVLPQQQINHTHYSFTYSGRNTGTVTMNSSGSSSGHNGKRKRSWSRAVFSNLQRKGLEKRFQIQKYIIKPDRRQLAATLGLTDAQVKVWFQNRRMKWRHSKESNCNKQETPITTSIKHQIPKPSIPTSYNTANANNNSINKRKNHLIQNDSRKPDSTSCVGNIGDDIHVD